MAMERQDRVVDSKKEITLTGNEEEIAFVIRGLEDVVWGYTDLKNRNLLWGNAPANFEKVKILLGQISSENVVEETTKTE
jgi:hypothetical protein